MQGTMTPPTAETRTHMRSREAADYVQLNRDHFNALVRQGLIPYVRVPHPTGGPEQRRYRRDDLDAFMAERVVVAPPPTPVDDPACDLDGEES